VGQSAVTNFSRQYAMAIGKGLVFAYCDLPTANPQQI